MTPERIAELNEFGLLGREAIDTIKAQQREIEALYGLLIKPAGKVFDVDLIGETFATEAAARAAVRAACGQKGPPCL